MIPQHLSLTNEHYTPRAIVESARRVLGSIDLDPASCEEANRIVKATDYYDATEDGLSHTWAGRVFLNPPGGTVVGSVRARYETKSSAVAWWRKLLEEWDRGSVEAAIFVGFTLEILRTSQSNTWQHPLDFSICIPRERLAFGGDRPTHANVIVYLGPHTGCFAGEFSKYGRCES